MGATLGATVVTTRGKPSKLDSLIYNAFVGSVEWAIVFKIATNAKFDNVVALVNGRKVVSRLRCKSINFTL